MKQTRLAIDIGGTFTDLAVVLGSKRVSTKVLTTPRAPEEGVLAGIDILMQRAKLVAGDIALIIHGTSFASNAISERKGARRP